MTGVPVRTQKEDEAMALRTPPQCVLNKFPALLHLRSQMALGSGIRLDVQARGR